MSIAIAQFQILAKYHVIQGMQTISETRVARLAMLVKRYGDSLAQLNEALGLDRTDSTLSQIRTLAPHSKTGKIRGMGDNLARKIEERLGLEHGWMDTPPTYAELGPDPMISELIKVALLLKEDGKTEDLAKLIRISHTFAEPVQKTGTSSQ